MATFFQHFTRDKQSAYSEFGHKNTPPFEVENYDFGLLGLGKADKTEPGFFTPYQSTDEFAKHLRSPVIMPLICLKETLKNLMSATIHLCESVLHLMDLSKDDSVDSFISAFTDTLKAAMYFSTALVDAVWELSALFCRTSSTAVSTTYGMGKSFAGLFTTASQHTGTEPETFDDTSNDQSNGLISSL